MTGGLALLAFKKRILRAKLGEFGVWRWIHVLLSAGAMIALLLHTGGRSGNALNLWLLMCVIFLVAAGGTMSLVIALEHRLQPRHAHRLRGGTAWLHVLLFWPLPVLLIFHVTKTYYF